MAKKILIVDDEPNIIVPLKFLMKQQGYEVREAHNGTEALKLAAEIVPDLIILDIMLPDITGLEVCQAIRKDTDLQAVKIILLTAKSREVDISKGMAMGADAYVIKPFSTKDLVKQIGDML